ncbi:MAG TPA: hypothetical protein VFB80_11180 [Pirellulaceae bacterium]|nr:hypothetical protein [Pirellulaceae bacterium]
MTKSPRRSRSKSPAGGLAGITLSELHARRVAIHLVALGREQFIRGQGQFEVDPDLGRVLRVKVKDPDGDFELVVSEAKWNGQVLPGQAVGCDYLLRLG